MASIPPAPRPLTNAMIARSLGALAQQLQAKGENPFKVRAYRRAAETISNLSESIDAEVRAGADLTRHAGIGKGIAAALHEIVFNSGPAQLELLLANAPPEAAALNDYPRLDPKRLLRAYKKLSIHSVDELKAKLEAGEVGRALGLAAETHFRQAFNDTREILLDEADTIARSVQRFLLEQCSANQAEPAGNFRRRVEVISELPFVIETDDFEHVVTRFKRYGGGLEPGPFDSHRASFTLPNGVNLRLEKAPVEKWGVALIGATGSPGHLQKLQEHAGPLEKWAKSKKACPDETTAYRALGLPFIPPELREGRDEVEKAAAGNLPVLVTLEDIRGDLHAHTTSSDGSHTIEEMAEAARARRYDYLGITDHSQSLKIAGGVSEENLWKQIRAIDRFNEKNRGGIRVLKSAEVDILINGSLDYPDELLAELDYTVCSIHSKFQLSQREQTERLMRAMDNPYFTILGHTTGRKLLRRPGYEVDLDRLIPHAQQAKVFFEINANPNRLDLSTENARRVQEAGIKIAICTDAHHIDELDYLRCGIDVARRAGLSGADILNTMPWPKLSRAIKRR